MRDVVHRFRRDDTVTGGCGRRQQRCCEHERAQSSQGRPHGPFPPLFFRCGPALGPTYS